MRTGAVVAPPRMRSARRTWPVTFAGGPSWHGSIDRACSELPRINILQAQRGHSQAESTPTQESASERRVGKIITVTCLRCVCASRIQPVFPRASYAQWLAQVFHLPLPQQTVKMSSSLRLAAFAALLVASSAAVQQAILTSCAYTEPALPPPCPPSAAQEGATCTTFNIPTDGSCAAGFIATTISPAPREVAVVLRRQCGKSRMRSRSRQGRPPRHTQCAHTSARTAQPRLCSQLGVRPRRHPIATTASPV